MIPPRTIVAATDFSEAATTALMFAARLARHCGATLHVVHAEHPLLSAAAVQGGIDLEAETREELRRAVTAAPPAGDCDVTLHAIAGAAVDAVIDVARAHRADLIVVGSKGMSGAERLVFGSTTEGLLRRSDVSVLVVPPAWRPPRAGTVDLAGVGPIIVAMDMTLPSLGGARAACALAQSLATTVEFVHVVADLSVPARWRRHAERAQQERVAEASKELEAAVRGLGCAVAARWGVETGQVADRLASIAGQAADRAPLLVLGRKAPRSEGGAPGTIAYRVLSLANVPVLMVVDMSARP